MSNWLRHIAVFIVIAYCGIAGAKVPPEKADTLGGDKFTCIGAERASSAGGVPEFSGKWLEGWPGLKTKQGYTPGPYADEKPLFTITAANAAQYAEHLTEGQKELLKAYPQEFKMPVYQSHRDFRPADWMCSVIKKNALSAEIKKNGLGLIGLDAGIPFPFPANGDEAIWNVIVNNYRPWNEESINDTAIVYGEGKIAWGRKYYLAMRPSRGPDKILTFDAMASAYFLEELLAPERDKGFVGSGWQPNDYTNSSTGAWQYIPGTRRVRQAPDICCDYPVPPAGMHTVDDNSGFTGNPSRYDWKIVGKREIYVPSNMYRINDPTVKYKDLLGKHSINPDFMRYELHRVWVIEGNLKPGYRHIYKKRVVYADEDHWNVPWADNYDSRGKFWRAKFNAIRYQPEAQAYHRGVAVYHDLSQGTYEATYLVNETGNGGWKLNNPAIGPQMFGPKAAQERGH